jgi:hypothetical protein
MKVYTYSDARQQLAALLDEASKEGEVRIRRRDGSVFAVRPLREVVSPLDIPSVKARLRPGELQEILDEARRSADPYWRRGVAEPKPRTPSRPPRKRSRNTR